MTRDSLLGRPWVAGFVFTRCSGPCPKITGTMRRLQDELSGVDARLVSFSVDPEWDTPDVLRAYADAVGADRERWWFLTGDRSAIYALISSWPNTCRRRKRAMRLHKVRFWRPIPNSQPSLRSFSATSVD